MTDHRNWALVTVGLFIILTGWSLWSERQERLPGKPFLAGLMIAGVLLASTAWHGAEGVYRYGLGVMSLPQAEGEGHSHNHDESGHVQSQTKMQGQIKPEQVGNKSVDHATEHRDNYSHQH